MNRIEALEILKTFHQKFDAKKPVKEQVAQLFVPTLWGNSICPADSLQGRAARILNKRQNRFSQEKIVFQTFTQALKTVQHDKSQTSQFPLSFLVQMERNFHPNEKTQANAKLNLPSPISQQMGKLEQSVKIAEDAKIASDKAEAEQIRKLSVLRSETPNIFPALSLEQFIGLLDEKSHKELTAYLRQRPEHAHPRFTEYLILIDEGAKFQKVVQDRFFPQNQPLDSKLRAEKLYETALQMKKMVKSLEPGKPWIYRGTYGREQTPAGNLALFLSKLPGEMTNGIPKEFLDVLETGNLPDPSQMIAQGISSGLNAVSNGMPDALKVILHNAFIGKLLPNESREITGKIAAVLPKCIKEGIESWMKQGLAGNIMEFVPDGETRDFILWMAEKGNKIKADPKESDALLKEIEAKATSFVQNPFKDLTTTFQSVIKQTTTNIPHLLPEPIMQLMGLDNLFASGQFWLEFAKQRNGKFTIKIYSTGQAVNFHPKDSDGKIQWPMILTDIPEDRLKSDFFHRLLYYHVEPKCNKECAASAKDLFEGLIHSLTRTEDYTKELLNSLNVSPESRTTSEWRQVSVSDGSENTFMQLLLTSPKKPNGLAQYEMHLEALIAYCKPLLKGADKTLTIEQAEVCTALETAMAKMSDEVEALGQALDESRIKRFEATVTEIKRAIAKYRDDNTVKKEPLPNKIQLPTAVLSTIKSVFETGGISADSLASAKSSLCWALGDEIGDLIDTIAYSLNDAAPAITSAVTPQASQAAPARNFVPSSAPKGWLRTILFHAYFEIVVKGIQLAMLLSRLYALSIGVLIEPLVQYALHRIIPTYIQEWVAELIDEAKRTLATYTLNIILRCFFTKEHAALVHNSLQYVRSTAKTWSSALLGNQQVSYTLDLPLPKESRESLFEIDLKARSNVAELGAYNTQSPDVNNCFLNARKLFERPITSNSIKDILTTIKHQFSQNEDVRVLCKYLKEFEIPVQGELGIWDQIDQPEVCLELLSDIALMLASKGKSNQTIISSFALLAIMDRLAKRCPESYLKGYSVDSYRLFYWLKNEIQIDDVPSLKQLEKLCQYFIPGSDLGNLPSKAQLYALSQKSLFDYSFLGKGWGGKPGEMDGTLSKSVLEKPEFRYLDERFSDPLVKEKIKKLGIDLKNLSELDKYLFLVTESSNFTRGEDAVLPRPYMLLRLQTLVCKTLSDYHPNQSLTVTGLKTKPPQITIDDRTVTEAFMKGDFGDAIGMAISRSTMSTSFPIIPELTIGYLPASQEELSTTTQTERMIERNRNCSKYNPALTEKFMLQGLISTDSTNDILRALAYFAQFPASLDDDHALHYILFDAGSLTKLLKDTPYNAEAIGTSLTQILNYLRENLISKYDFYIILTQKVKSICQHYAPEYCHTFPNLQEHINRALTEYRVKYCAVLSAIALGPPSDTMNEIEEEKALSIICKAKFLVHGRKDKSYDHKVTDELCKEFMWQYAEWLPVLERRLHDNPDFRYQLIQEMISLFQITPPPRGIAWIVFKNPQKRYLRFLTHGIDIDFEKGIFTGQLIPNNLEEMSKAIQAKFHIHEPLLIDIEGSFRTANRDFELTIKDGTYTCKRQINGKPYRYVNSAHIPGEKSLTTLWKDYPLGATCWLEETNQPIKSFIISLCTINKEFLIQKEEDPYEYYHLHARVEDGLQLESAKGTFFKNQLAPLTRFCQLEDIDCAVYEKSIKTIAIPRYQLTFHVKGDRAYCDSKPGFYINPVQTHPTLNNFPAFLLLRNDSGEMSVLIPSAQWISGFAWQYLTNLGPLANLATGYLNKWNSSIPGLNNDKNSSYTYSIDPVSNQLSSDNPEALGYLMSLYLLQGDIENATQACIKLELLSKCMPIPDTIIRVLYPLFIPIGIKGVTHLRQRLMAALEENRLIHEKKAQRKTSKQMLQEAKKKEDKKFPTQSFMIALILLNDFINPQEMDPREKLTDYQQWYLFKKLFFCLSEMIDYSSHFTGKDLIHKIGKENFIECCLSPHLQQQYAALKRRLGKKDSLVMQTVRVSRKVLAAPSSAYIPHVSVAPTIYDANAFSDDLYKAVNHMGSLYMDDLRHLNYKQLREVMINSICSIPALTVGTITPETLRREFLTYYSLARGDLTNERPEQYRQLGKLLPLIQGGWDSQTALLIKFLSAVYAMPIIFPKTLELSARLMIKDHTSADFFEKLNDRLFYFQMASKGGQIICKTVMNQTVSSTMNMGNPLYQLIPMPSLTLPTWYWGSKLYNAYTEYQSTQVVPVANVNRVHFTNSYSSLSEIDTKMDTVLDQLFNMTFDTVVYPQLQKRAPAVTPFQTNSDEPAEKVAIERVNASIRDFYNRPTSEGVFLRLKSHQRLWDLYLNLMTCKNKLYKDIEVQRTRILQMVNLDSFKSKQTQPITFKELQQWFLSENHAALKEISNLTLQTLQHLDVAVAHDAALLTRLQQVERSIRHLEELSRLDPNSQQNDFNQKVEQLADELKSRRAYSFDTLEPRLLKRFITFELRTDKMLWKKQAECLQQLLLHYSLDAVIELLMSFGKTFFGIPTINSFAANGKHVVFNIWPSALIGANVRQISKQSHEVYGQTANVLHFNRQRRLAPEEYDAILMLLQKAQTDGETINMTREDAQAVELLFLDMLYRATHSRMPPSIFDSHITNLAGILRVMGTVGKAVGDEAHEEFNDKQELNYPIGSPSIVPLKYYQIFEACMSHVAKHPKLRQLIAINDSEGIQKILNDDVIPYLADKMSHYWKFGMNNEAQTKENEGKRKEFITFVMDKAIVIPTWIRNSPLYGEISLVKGLLTVLLPMVWKNVVNVGYGPSNDTNKGGEYARPYDGNTKPLEQSTIRDSYEAMTKTFIMFLHRKFTVQQCTFAIHSLQSKMENEMKARNVPGTATVAYKLFERCAPKDVTLINYHTLDYNEKAYVIDELAKHEEIIFFYIREYVWKEIKYWKKNLNSDAQNFGSMFHTQYHDTGTPYNDGSYPDHLTMLFDPGTIGEALHLLTKKCPQDGIHLLQKSRPVEILDEVLETYFKPGSNFSALIDGGAQLHGMDNLTVAKQMLNFVTRHRPDIRAIDFFMADDSGRDQLVTLEVGATKVIPYDQCPKPTKERLAYFDQVHGFGANIPQKYNGVALNLIGSKHALYRLLQEVFRMRGIKVFIRFLKKELNPKELDELNLTSTQTVHLAMTKEVRELISGNRLPTLRDIICFAINCEAKIIAEQNYNSFRKKIKNVIRRAMLDKVLANQTPSAMVSVFKKCEHVFVSQCEDDPAKLYGLIGGKILTDLALESCKKIAIESMVKSGVFTEAEQKAIIDKLNALKKPPMPKEVYAYQDNGRPQTDLMDQLGKETSLDQDQEQECDQELQSNQLTTSQLSTISPFEEWQWPTDVNPLTLEWQRFHNFTPGSSWKLVSLMHSVKNTTGLVLSKMQKRKIEPPPLLRVTDLLKTSDSKNFVKVATAFDTRIWMSNNFLPKVLRNVLESEAELGSQSQREVLEVLVHAEEDEKQMKFHSVGCLSQYDASVWRKMLTKMDPQVVARNKKSTVILYDIALRSVTACNHPKPPNLRQNKEFLRMEAQLRFLNGSVNYGEDLVPVLTEWMKKSNSESMQNAFQTILAQKGGRQMTGSDMDLVISNFLQVPANEMV